MADSLPAKVSSPVEDKSLVPAEAPSQDLPDLNALKLEDQNPRSSTSFQYVYEKKLDDTKLRVQSVKFDISRYGKYTRLSLSLLLLLSKPR